MDCPSEEQMIRMKLEAYPQVKYLDFDIPNSSANAILLSITSRPPPTIPPSPMIIQIIAIKGVWVDFSIVRFSSEDKLRFIEKK